MIKFKTTKSGIAGGTAFALSSLALSTALLLGTTAPVRADFTVANGQTQTDQTVTLAAGETGTVEAGGTIQDSATHAITATGNVTVDNAGTVVTTSAGDDGLRNAGGTLTLFNRATGTITGAANGVVTGTLASLTNTGTITGTTASGVNANTLTSLINSGTIESDNVGVLVSGTATNVVNTGTIKADKTGLGIDIITKLDNSGTITGRDNNGVNSTTITSLVNTGTIDGGASGSSYDGVFAFTLLTSLVNSGTIIGGDDGVYAGTLTKLVNTGTITGSGYAGVNAGTIINLLNSDTITGAIDGVAASAITNLTNTGTITGNGSRGLQVTNTLGNLTNSGTISGPQYGIQANALTSLTNSGTIKSGANGNNAVYITGTIGSFTNTGSVIGGSRAVSGGTITDLTNSGTIEGKFTGVAANIITTLTNTGTISGKDYGVGSNTIGSLTNSGTISGSVFAIRAGNAGADTMLTLLAGSNISGPIELGGGTNTLVIGEGLSIDLTFASLPQVIKTTGTSAVAVGNRVITVDTSSLLASEQDEQLSDLTSGIWGTVFSQLANQSSSSGVSPALSYAATSPAQSSAIEANFGDDSNDDRFRMWAKVFGSHRQQDGATPATDTKHNVGGLIFGLDSQIDPTTSLGAFFGVSKTNIETGANQQSDVKSFFGGLYAGFNADYMTVNLGIAGGTTDHNGTRLVDNNLVAGLQTITRTFDGTFIAPEIAVSSQYDVSGTTLQPTVSVGYTGMFLDGYTEAGTSAPLTVASRDMHLLHARLELAALLGSNDGEQDYSFTPYAGIEGRSLIGGDTVDATLLGQNISFTPGGAKNIASVFLGTRMSVTQTEDFNIFASFEASYDTEQSSTIAGDIGFKWQF